MLLLCFTGLGRSAGEFSYSTIEDREAVVNQIKLPKASPRKPHPGQPRATSCLAQGDVTYFTIDVLAEGSATTYQVRRSREVACCFKAQLKST